MNEYLPATTLTWCETQLQRLGFDITQPVSDPTAPYRDIYLQLRTALDEHILSGSEPELGLSIKPTGALNWQPPDEIGAVRHVHLAGDGADNDGIDALQEENQTNCFPELEYKVLTQMQHFQSWTSPPQI